MKEYLLFWKNYFNFKSKSTRKEFWIPEGANVIVQTLLACLTLIIPLTIGNLFYMKFYNVSVLVWTINMIIYIFRWIILIPTWAVSIRRFRDAGVKWYWCLPIEIAISAFMTLTNSYTPLQILLLIIGAGFLIFVFCKPSNSMKKNIFWD